MNDTLTLLERAATTQTIRVRLEKADIERLRAIARAERRPPADQAAWLLEQAIRAWDGNGDGCPEASGH
jgi:hypothetical protein